MTALLFPALYTLFLWWFTTGIIIVVYGRGAWLKHTAFVLTTLLMGLALAGVVVVSGHDNLLSVYLAVTCGVVIWAWQVAGYYLGFVTGLPAAPMGDTDTPSLLRDRFWQALRSSLHHELLAVFFGIVLFALTWNAPNRWSFWIYVALWLMHASAKLNVFFGVRNFRIELLPPHLHHLGGLLSDRDHNGFFPVSVLVATSVLLLLVYRAIVPDVAIQETVGLVMIATMMALGVLEHWLLVLPVSSILWGFGVRPLREDLNAPAQQSLKG